MLDCRIVLHLKSRIVFEIDSARFFPARSIEFRRELRLEAACCLFELSLSARDVPQQFVHLLWTHHQQTEYKYEQNFGTEPHASPPSYALVVGNGGCCCADRLLVVSFHGCLKAADALSNSFTEVGELFGSEHEQGNSENNQQMHRLKQSFKHKCSFRLSDNISKHVEKCRRCKRVTTYSACPGGR